MLQPESINTILQFINEYTKRTNVSRLNATIKTLAYFQLTNVEFSQEEIAIFLGVTKQRVFDIEKISFKKIKNMGTHSTLINLRNDFLQICKDPGNKAENLDGTLLFKELP